MYTDGLNPCAFKALLCYVDLFFFFKMDRTVEKGM
jgi:hypothetical protein